MTDSATPGLGTFVLHDGLPAVVVGLPDGSGIGAPEGHLALWYGEPRVTRLSRGGPGNPRPVVWTVPSEYCEPCSHPDVKH